MTENNKKIEFTENLKKGAVKGLNFVKDAAIHTKDAVVAKFEEQQIQKMQEESFVKEPNCTMYICEYTDGKKRELFAYKNMDESCFYFLKKDEKNLICNMTLCANNQVYTIIDIDKETTLLKDKYKCVKAQYEIHKAVSITKTSVINNNFQNANVNGNISIYNSAQIESEMSKLKSEIGKISNPFKRKEAERMFVTFGDYVNKRERNQAFFEKFLSYLAPLSTIAFNIATAITNMIH